MAQGPANYRGNCGQGSANQGTIADLEKDLFHKYHGINEQCILYGQLLTSYSQGASLI